MSTRKRFPLSVAPATVVVERTSGTGPLRYGSTYSVEVEFADGSVERAGSLVVGGRGRWVLYGTPTNRIHGSGVYLGPLKEAAIALAYEPATRRGASA